MARGEHGKTFDETLHRNGTEMSGGGYRIYLWHGLGLVRTVSAVFSGPVEIASVKVLFD